MSLQPIEQQWVARLATQAKVRAAKEKQQEQRDAVVERMAGQIEKVRKEIAEKIQSLEAGDGKTTMKLLDYLTRDQTTEFDLADQMNGMGLSEAAQKKLSEIGLALDLLAKEMNAKVRAIDPLTGDETDVEVPLFSAADLKAELYQPVVRQGLMSDTFVADEYSDTAALLKGSFEAYKERLDEEGVKSETMDNIKLGLTIGKGVASIVSGGVGLKGLDDEASSWKPDLEFLEKLGRGEPGEVADMCAISLELVSMEIEAAEQVTESLEEAEKDLVSEEGPPEGEGEESARREKALKARRASVAAKVAAQMTAAMATALGSEWKGGAWNLGVPASAAFGAALKPARMARQLATSPLAAAQINAVVDLVKAAFAAAMKACDPQSPAADGRRASGDILTDAGAAMGETFQASLAVDALVRELGEEKYGEAINRAADAARAAVRQGRTVDKLDELFADPHRLQAAQVAAGQALSDDFKKEIEDAERRDKLQLAMLLNEREGEKQAGALARRIKTMERDEQLVNWAAGIAGLGIDVASKFIGPLAIAGSALSLAQDVAKAAKRTRDWYNFYDSQQDLFAAASPFSAPVANFHHNARKQAIHYQINAALDLVNMIGAIAETGGAAALGIGVVAGKAIQGAASIAAALESVIYEIDKRLGLERAWSTYRAALESPSNRRLGLIALKENPTLAKYAVAWGAIVKKDALVGDFLSRCAMTAEELQDPKSRVEDVVKYLELRMPDDNTVVGREVSKSGWQPVDSAIVLTAASWASAKKLAEVNGGLEAEATRDVEVALLDFAKAERTLVSKTDHETARGHLDRALSAMDRYRPRRKGQGVEHAEMKALVARFRQKGRTRLGQLDDQIRTL